MPNPAPPVFTDDRARDRYAANGGNWADQRQAARPNSGYPTRVVVLTAVVAFALGLVIAR